MIDHSTEPAAIIFVNELVVDMYYYKIPTSALIELYKAFLTLNHDFLISKLKYFSVSCVDFVF